jgi:hypothetical protein
MDELMTVRDAKKRLAKMREDGETVSFDDGGLEVKLKGRFGMDDIEALFVLLLSPDTKGEKL